MKQTPYQHAAQQEVALLNKWKARKYEGVRSAGSHGKVDVTLWNEKEFLFIAHQLPNNPWHPNKMRDVLSMKRPPNSRIFFYCGTADASIIDEDEARRRIAAYEKANPNEPKPI